MNQLDVEADFKRLAEHYAAYGLEPLEFGQFMLLAVLKFLFDTAPNRSIVRLMRRDATAKALMWHESDKQLTKQQLQEFHAKSPATRATKKPVADSGKPRLPGSS